MSNALAAQWTLFSSAKHLPRSRAHPWGETIDTDEKEAGTVRVAGITFGDQDYDIRQKPSWMDSDEGTGTSIHIETNPEEYDEWILYSAGVRHMQFLVWCTEYP